jgi:hypothetical protein
MREKKKKKSATSLKSDHFIMALNCPGPPSVQNQKRLKLKKKGEDKDRMEI